MGRALSQTGIQSGFRTGRGVNDLGRQCRRLRRPAASAEYRWGSIPTAMSGPASVEERAPHGRHLAERSAGLMHPRNPYKANPPDFAALARFDPDFAQHVRPGGGGSSQIDWSSSEAVVALTRTLLWQHFGLRWHLPPGRLCPTVPSRLNYLFWLQDLIAARARPSADGDRLTSGTGAPAQVSSPKTSGSAAPAPGLGVTAGGRGGQKKAAAGKENSTGPAPPPLCVDIGTGASAIYALLGAAVLGWDFVATEVEAEAAEAAAVNVKLNGLEAKIDVRRVSSAQGGGGEEGGREGGRGGGTEGLAKGGGEGNGDGGGKGGQEISRKGRGKSGRKSDRKRDRKRASIEDDHGGQKSSRAADEASAASPLPSFPPAREAVEASRPACHPSSRPANLPGCCACASAAIRGPLLLGVLRPSDRPDACMCNPPFYDASERPRGRADWGEDAPRSAAVHTELFTPGGEVGFVSALIDESLFLGGAVGWYSSLVGRKASIEPLVNKLRRARVPQVQVPLYPHSPTCPPRPRPDLLLLRPPPPSSILPRSQTPSTPFSLLRS